LTWNSLRDASTVTGRYPTGALSTLADPVATPCSNFPVVDARVTLQDDGALVQVAGMLTCA
jgi:hypothetical protein